MQRQLRPLRFECLEGRRLLAAVNIPVDLTAQVGAQIAAPVNIDTANGVRGAEIRLQYDPTILRLTPENVQAGSTLNGSDDVQVVANVDSSTGTIVIFISASTELGNISGSLVVLNFSVLSSAGVGTEADIDLVKVTLNEGAIQVNPAPIAGSDTTDGRVTIVGGQVTPTDRLGGRVYADTNSNNLPDPQEAIPGVEITLTNLDTNATWTTTTDSSGSYRFTELNSGRYRVTQTQPKAYVDGGPNEFVVDLALGQDLSDVNFRELGLLPQFVYTRFHTTTVMPVMSGAWTALIEKANHDAASNSISAFFAEMGETAAANASMWEEESMGAGEGESAESPALASMGVASPPVSLPRDREDPADELLDVDTIFQGL